MDEETAERIFDQSTLTGFYKTEIRPCKAMCKRTQQLPTSLAQHCWELLCPFARS